MAKKLKFNLILDGFSVRNIEGIQEHFSLKDMLGYYKSGLLKKWLEVRGYEDQLKSLNSIGDNATQKEIAKALVEIFDIDMDSKKLEEALYVLDSQEEEQKRNEDEKQRYEEYARLLYLLKWRLNSKKK